MQFEKEDVGYCSKLSGVMESWLFAESGGEGGGERVSVGKTEVNIGRISDPHCSCKKCGHVCLNVWQRC